MFDKDLIKRYLKRALSISAAALLVAAVPGVPLVKELRLARKLDNDYAGIMPAPENNISETVYFNININTASEHQLRRLYGIGEATARAIVEYREENGFFKSAEELLNVKGIGEKTLELIWGRVEV